MGATEGGPPHFHLLNLGGRGSGKTTLTAAITQVLSKQQAATARAYRDLLIKPTAQGQGRVSYVEVFYGAEGKTFTQYDCPTRTDYLLHLLESVPRMDGCLLLVDLTADSLPNVRPWVQWALKAGVTHTVAFLNKADRLDDEPYIALMAMELRNLLGSAGLARGATSVVVGSALKATQGDAAGEQSVLNLLFALSSGIAVSNVTRAGRTVRAAAIAPEERTRRAQRDLQTLAGVRLSLPVDELDEEQWTLYRNLAACDASSGWESTRSMELCRRLAENFLKTRQLLNAERTLRYLSESRNYHYRDWKGPRQWIVLQLGRVLCQSQRAPEGVRYLKEAAEIASIYVAALEEYRIRTDQQNVVDEFLGLLFGLDLDPRERAEFLSSFQSAALRFRSRLESGSPDSEPDRRHLDAFVADATGESPAEVDSKPNAQRGRRWWRL